jgi:hypothetical protein
MTQPDEDSDVGEQQVARRRLLELIGGHEISAAIGAFARLAIPDFLAEEPASAAALATRMSLDPGALDRLLRCMAFIGVVERHGSELYKLTRMGQLLLTGVPGSVRLGAIVSTEGWMWQPYAYLADTIKTGQTAFVAVHGTGLWQYLDAHPDAAVLFNAQMSAGATRLAEAFVGKFDFAGIERIVDIGGGHGTLMSAVLQANPTMRGVVFDRPSVIADAAERLGADGVADRCELIAGDFFESVPIGADAYVLSWIIHDWDDHAALRILRNIRNAISDQGRIVVIEELIPDGGPPDFTRSNELTMLAVAGGRERSETEYRQLYEAADFELISTRALEPLSRYVIEGRPC